MGEIAEDIFNGSNCSWCGQYFEEKHGYPVVCKSCADGKSNAQLLQESGVQNAINKEL